MTLQSISHILITAPIGYLAILWFFAFVAFVGMLIYYVKSTNKEKVEEIVEQKSKKATMVKMLNTELVNIDIQLEMIENDLKIASKFNAEHALSTKKYLKRLITLGEYLYVLEDTELQNEIMNFVEYVDALVTDIPKIEEIAYQEVEVHQKKIARVTRQFEEYKAAQTYDPVLLKQEASHVVKTEKQKLNDLIKLHNATRTQLHGRLKRSQAILAQITTDLNTYTKSKVEQKKFYLRKLAYI